MMTTKIDALKDKINHGKKELIRIAMTTGINSHETINYSQKLDQLITEYQAYSYEKKSFNNYKETMYSLTP